MQKVVRWSCALLAALSVLGGSDCRAAQPTPSARAYILLDAESGRVETLEIRGRHDACIALRAGVVVEAAVAIALADLKLTNFR